MSLGEWLAVTALVAAALPAALLFGNLPLYRPRALLAHAGAEADAEGWSCAPPELAVSVLVPARDEAEGIEAAVRAVLMAAEGDEIEFELVVLDDNSSDDTYDRVAALAATDARVRIERAPSLPPGWCGKQHACHVLAGLARHPLLLFLDADVRLEPRALGRCVTLLEASEAGLLSGFPRQVTVTTLERLLIPLIHFVLLGFLPLGFMRWSRAPGFGAGCGQLMLVRAEAYARAGGHEAIRGSLHDGVQLPRAFRRAGIATELFDATRVARCRMYHSAAEVWNGLGKNATEGLASPRLIGPMTLWLLTGQVLPPILLVAGLAGALSAAATLIAAGACLLVWVPRLAMRRVFAQPLDSVLLHPFGILALLAIQWQALWRRSRGRGSAWKGRSYPVSNNPSSDLSGTP